MDRLDFEVFLVLDWQLERWCLGEQEVSLGEAQGVVTLKVDGARGVVEELLERLRVVGAGGCVAPVEVPLVGLMSEVSRG